MLKFQKIKLKNFGPYHEAEIDLRDKGFCIIRGENHCLTDNAKSNGCGKSSLANAICFALTGETISGVSKNLANNNPDSDEAYVELSLNYNNNDFIIKRILKPKSDMKIIKNGKDISGKGIKESNVILAQELPDIDYNLISSTIILGQGMPAKLSSFTPSGRKELLERLTKSDFMIEDMKKRVSARLDKLNKDLRGQEDSNLLNASKLDDLSSRIDQLESQKENAVKPDFDKMIQQAKKNIFDCENGISSQKKLLDEVKSKQDAESKKYFSLLAQKTKIQSEELSAYNSSVNSLIENRASLSADIKSLEKEIFQLKNIRDICPMCGQKIPGVHKRDTSKQEAQLKDYQARVSKLNEELNDKNRKHAEYNRQIDESFKKDIDSQNNIILVLSAKQRELDSQLSSLYGEQSQFNTELNRLTYEQENYDKQQKALLKEIDDSKKQAKFLQESIKKSKDIQIDLNSRLEIVKKMDTLIKRDFRGYLLTNIINYLDKKAKEYCQIVFGNDKIKLELSGNNLDISYDNKMFDNLSGGEKQRVDIMLQFAVRDLMNRYFNVDSNIIVLDEITDYLDNQSCQAVIKLITDKLNDIESVFIISHHMDELGIPVDSQIHIVKDEAGVSSIQ